MNLNRLFRMRFFLLCILLLCSKICFADNYESFEDLQTIVKNFVTKNISLQQDETLAINVNQLDPELKLPICSTKIDASLPPNSNHQQITAVELACNGKQSWHTFLPVNVQILTNVLVTNKAIPAKDLISETDLDYAAYNKNQLMSGYYQDKTLVVGQEASQLIPAGAILTQKNLRSPVMVHKDQMVQLIAQHGPITVSINAISKMDGRLNDAIKVMNPSSNRTLDAVVVGEDKAKVLG